MRTGFFVCILSFALMALVTGSAAASPLREAAGTAFTYQGRLTEAGEPAEGVYDFEFKLFDALSEGSQVGSTITREDVSVSAGLFTVQLDFGDVFAGSARYLEIGVRPGASVDPYMTLTPRQALSVAPQAQYAAKAPWSGLSGIPDGFADAIDNDTLYTAGTGLALVGLEFSVDTAAIQQRVSGTCGSGSAIRLIGADGTVTCESVAGSDHNHWGASWSGSGTGLTLNGSEVGVSGTGGTYGLYGTSEEGSGVRGESTNAAGVYGFSTNSVGVQGQASGNRTGVYGTSERGSGVQGYSIHGYGVSGFTSDGTGVYGHGNMWGRGVEGVSPYGEGVFGYSDYGEGVHGMGNGSSTGIYGTSDSGSGVKGFSNEGYAVRGDSNSSAAIFGGGNTGVGIQGQSLYGDGILGETVYGVGKIGVRGESASGTGVAGSGEVGVYGEGTSGGIHGIGSAGYGVFGEGTGAPGVKGSSSNDSGVYGFSAGGDGVHGEGWNGVYGTGGLAGVYGTGSNIGVQGVSSTGTGIKGESTTAYGVEGSSTSSIGVHGISEEFVGMWAVGPRGVLAQSTSAGQAAIEARALDNSGDWAGFFWGNVHVIGNLSATGAKPAVVETESYGRRRVYAVESPELWFEDFGMGQLVRGEAAVQIDPVFAETVNLNETYFVFLTPWGDCPLYVKGHTPTSFSVAATGSQKCSIEFQYRIVAKRLGYEGVRLQPDDIAAEGSR